MEGPDTNNAETPSPIWGFGPPSPEPDTKKLDALLASLNGSAERFQTLWFSFLGLTLYLAIAALATTHRNLLLGEPQVLPILNIKVELLPFYVIAPLLYLVFHFYLLMMLALLARTAAEFDKQLRTTLPGEPERERYRAQVGNALFLQLLVGMKGERTGINAFLMGLIALITIVLAPLATLVLMQMMFLPYHHLRITWWHRGIVVADLVLIVVMTYRCFFPRGVTKAPLVLGALSRKPRWATAMGFWVLLAVALIPAVRWLSFEQGRWAGEPSTSSWQEWAQWMEGEPPPASKVKLDYTAAEKGVVFGWFPSRLKLPNEPVVGKDRLEEIRREIASRGGEFVPTRNFEGRDLQAADLRGADLRGVNLGFANLQGAHLGGARLDAAHLLCAAQFKGVACAHLEGAVLTFTQLQGALLPGANLQGADLLGAYLYGAELGRAQLQGAQLFQAHLQGAHLRGAHLEGANLGNAQLEGASLESASLQGAILEGADLQGAGLSFAQLQGADLTGARMADTDFNGGLVFGTKTDDTDLFTAAISNVRQDALTKEVLTDFEPLTRQDLKNWIAAATEFAGETNRTDIAARFGRVEKAWATGIVQKTPKQVTWTGMQELYAVIDPDGVSHRRRLALILGDIACGAEGAPSVARALSDPFGGRFNELGDQLDRLKTARKESDAGGAIERLTVWLNGPKTCPGVIGFTEKDWRELDANRPD